MNHQKLKLYLSQCIKKNRTNKYNQYELSQDICSRYTLSRIENKNTNIDIEIYHKLLKRLDLYYKEVLDFTILDVKLKHLTILIEYNKTNEIKKEIPHIKEILDRNKKNVIFENQLLLYNYLVTHYINKEKIIPSEDDNLLFEFTDPTTYTLLVHVYCESMLFNGLVKEFHDYYENLKIKRGNILLDFFYMYYLQINGQTLMTNDIFMSYKEDFKKDFKTYQLIRFRSMVALGYIEYETPKALHHFDKITELHTKSKALNHYYIFCILGYASIFIKRKQYQEAYDLVMKQDGISTFLLPNALPYIIFLSLRVNHTIDDKFLVKGISPLCDACIEYYNYCLIETNGTNRLQYLHRTLPKLLKFYKYNEPIITLIKAESQYLINVSHCYRSGIKFDQKLKKYCKEVSTL